jgi:hypothetical protein
MKTLISNKVMLRMAIGFVALSVVALSIGGCATVDSARLDKIESSLGVLAKGMDEQNTWIESTIKTYNEMVDTYNRRLAGHDKDIQALAVGVKALLEESMARDGKTGFGEKF